MGQIHRTPNQELIGKRAEYLDALIGASLRKTEITNVLDASRSTVDRAVNELEDADLVKRVNGEFTATLTGELGYKRYAQYADFHENLSTAKPIVNAIDGDVDLPLALFEDAQVISSSPQLPEQPAMDTYNRLVKESPYLKGLAPAAMSIYTDWIHELMVEDGHEFEIIATETVYELLQNALQDGFEPLTGSEQFDFYVTSEEFPYALWFVSVGGVDHLGMTVYGDTGPIGAVVSKNEAAIEWGKSEYNSYLETAERIF